MISFLKRAQNHAKKRLKVVRICVADLLFFGHLMALSMTNENQNAGHSAIDENVIHKYNRPAPRYTSYPTALKFCTIDDDESREAMCLDAADDNPMSLYFHLPFCRSLCWFCGCTKIISTNQSLADTYIGYLEKEIALVRPHLGDERNVVQIHFGGGTPNFLRIMKNFAR